MGRFCLAVILFWASQAFADLVISDAQVRAMPPGQPNTAAFLTLKNTSAQSVTLVSAKTNAAKKAEFHNHIKNAAGVMSMQQVASINIEPNASFVFKSGSYHIMLMGLNKMLKPGESVSLELTDQQGRTYTYDVPVVSMMGGGMHHHHHHGEE